MQKAEEKDPAGPDAHGHLSLFRGLGSLDPPSGEGSPQGRLWNLVSAWAMRVRGGCGGWEGEGVAPQPPHLVAYPSANTALISDALIWKLVPKSIRVSSNKTVIREATTRPPVERVPFVV